LWKHLRKLAGFSLFQYSQIAAFSFFTYRLPKKFLVLLLLFFSSQFWVCRLQLRRRCHYVASVGVAAGGFVSVSLSFALLSPVPWLSHSLSVACFTLNVTFPHSSLACFIYPFLRFVLSLARSLLPSLATSCACMCVCMHTYMYTYMCVVCGCVGWWLSA